MHVLPENVERMLSSLENRVLVFFSLVFYLILTVFGWRRRYIAGAWISFVVWSAYIAADATGTIALGRLVNLSRECGTALPCPSMQLQIFWVPILLFYLGGPDTITAYSLEDNELWLRHFLSLLIQTGLAIYVSLRAWNNSLLSFLAIPLFISGIIKYVERTFMLRSSSNQCFKASAEHDPSPVLIKKAMRDMRKKKERPQMFNAFFLFTRFARLFAGLVLKDEEADKTSKIFHENSVKDAFEMVAIELGIMYDMLYTKAAFVYSGLGIFFRFFSFISSVFVLVIFSILSTHLIHESATDIFLTYSLLLGAIFAEVYTFIHHSQSDWTKLIWPKFNTQTPKFFSSLSLFNNHKRWSETLGQFNLLSYCIEDLSTTSNGGIRKLLYLLNSFYRLKDMNDKLQELIFTEIERKIQDHKVAALLGETERGDHHKEAESLEFRKNALAERGDHVLKTRYGLGDELDWCTIKAEFEYSILAWHIATDLCYYKDLEEPGDNDNDNLDPNRNLSICLSDYMLYLLIQRPQVMPKGIGDLRFRETCIATKSFLTQDWFDVANEKSEVLKNFFKREVPTDNKDDSLSVLRGGRFLFGRLQELESKNDWSKQKKWKMITEMWMELLTFAANQSGWIEHAQQLKHGGELLTVVRLLMANLGLSEQYRTYGRSIP